MKRKIWFLIIGAILGVGLIAAAISFFVHNVANVIEVSDLKAQAQSLQGRQLTVKGQVAPGSVNWDDRTKATSFALTDGLESLSILYRGTPPDVFKPGANVEVQGSYRTDGVFEAQSFGRPASFCAICHG